MIWAARQLLTPLRYLCIRQGSGWFKSKATYDWALPALLTAVTVGVFWVSGAKFEVFAPDGLIDKFAGLLDLMAAFFIAALAAVATFERKGLDEKMKGEPATLVVYRGISASKDELVLTRRQFVCYLFGYLSFAALAMFIVLRFAEVIAPGILASLPPGWTFVAGYGRIAFLLLVLFFFWQLVVTMLLGIYFLTDRLQVMSDDDL